MGFSQNITPWMAATLGDRWTVDFAEAWTEAYEAIALHQTGQPLKYVVDRTRGD